MDIQAHIFHSPEYRSVVDKAVEFVLGSPVHDLQVSEPFPGVGVYILYYHGTFRPYRLIRIENRTEPRLPIYAGKAVPAGWRTARHSSISTSQQLYHRLREHSRSIEQSSNLSVAEFKFRFMILEGAEVDLIAGCEAQIIRRFKPLWNNTIDGFGNHDPGSGRYNQAKSEWDVLHPGRPWANRLTGSHPGLQQILAKLRAC